MANSVKFPCPSCGKRLRADVAQVGHKVACSGCRGQFLVPPCDDNTIRGNALETPIETHDGTARTLASRLRPTVRSARICGGLMVGIASVLMVAVVFSRRLESDTSVLPTPSLAHDVSSNTKPSTKKTPAAPTTAKVAKPNKRALVDGLRVSGKLIGENIAEETGILGSWRWNLNIQIFNENPVSIQMGHLLILIQTDNAATRVDGMVLCKGISRDAMPPCLKSPNPFVSYGASHYRVEWRDGTRENYGNGVLLEPFFPEDLAANSQSFDDIPANSERKYELALNQLLENRLWREPRVTLVFPELSPADSDGVKRTCLIVDFKKTDLASNEWKCVGWKTLDIERQRLVNLLVASETDPVIRVLAANWLVEEYPKEAREILVRASCSEKSGPLLAVCLKLLADLRGEGLEQRAVSILQDKEMPQDVRQWAAVYLGSVKYKPALALLAAAVRCDEPEVGRAAIGGLGRFGGREAGAALIDLLKDPNAAIDHAAVMLCLDAMRDPELTSPLKELAGGGNDLALEVLVEWAFPETFDFFLARFRRETETQSLELLAEGLDRTCQGTPHDKALTSVFLDLLQTPDSLSDEALEVVVEFVLRQNPSDIIPPLTTLAREENGPALWILSVYKDDAAGQALRNLTDKAPPAVLAVILEALVNQWPKQSFNQFAMVLEHDNSVIVQLGVAGLGRSDNPAALPLLLPLVNDRDVGVRMQAIEAIARLPANQHEEEILRALLSTHDSCAAEAMVSALVKSGFHDRAAVNKLKTKLRSASTSLLRYQIVRLLSFIADKSQGPKSYTEFRKDEQRWIEAYKDTTPSR